MLLTILSPLAQLSLAPSSFFRTMERRSERSYHRTSSHSSGHLEQLTASLLLHLSTMMLDERWKNALAITAIVLAGLFVVAQAIKLWAKSICEYFGS